MPIIELTGQDGGGHSRALRCVYRLSERSIDKRGNTSLPPEYVLEGWTTTLGSEVSGEPVIALYRDRATHTQFHASSRPTWT